MINPSEILESENMSNISAHPSPGTCHPLPVSLSWGQVVTSKVNRTLLLAMVSLVSDILPFDETLTHGPGENACAP